MANELRVRAPNAPALNLTSAISSGATSISAPELAEYPVIGATNHMAIFDRDDPADAEVMYITAHSAGATTATVARGKEGTTAKAHAAGEELYHGPTVRDFVKVSNVKTHDHTGENISTADEDLHADLEITLSAFEGDIIDAHMHLVTNAGAGSGDGRFDVRFDASSTYFGAALGGNIGWEGWYVSNNAGNHNVSGAARRRVASGDLSSNTITLVFAGRSSAVNGIQINGTVRTFAINWGPEYVAETY